MIAFRMAGEQGIRFVRSTFVRAHHFAVRLSHRRRAFEPFDDSRQGVVITGAAGVIGRVLRADLADKYSLRTIDQLPASGIDLVANVHLTKHSDILAGYSILFAGSFIKNTAPPGPNHDAFSANPELFYLQYSYKW